MIFIYIWLYICGGLGVDISWLKHVVPWLHSSRSLSLSLVENILYFLLQRYVSLQSFNQLCFIHCHGQCFGQVGWTLILCFVWGLISVSSDDLPTKAPKSPVSILQGGRLREEHHFYKVNWTQSYPGVFEEMLFFLVKFWIHTYHYQPQRGSLKSRCGFFIVRWQYLDPCGCRPRQICFKLFKPVQ